MTKKEQKFIECFRKDPDRTRQILKIILDSRTSSKKAPAPCPSENGKL